MSVPNQLTVMRIILTPLVMVLLRFEGLYFRCATLAVFFIAALTDWYDGKMARQLGEVSSLGKFLDPLADKILVLSTLFALAYFKYIALWMVVVIMSRDIVVTLLRVYAQWKQQPVVTSMLAKAKTVSQMTAIYVIMILLILHEIYFDAALLPGWLSAIKDYDVVGVIMHIVVWVTVFTAVQYLSDNRRHLRSLALACIRVIAPGNLAK